MEPVTAGQRKGGTGRLIGVDAARALALIGMMSVHLLPGTDPDGSASTAYLISSGRASALFAVLAGVGLALANGATVPPAGNARLAASAGIVGRAAVLGLLGLFLGDLDSGVAVILVNYAFLFLVRPPSSDMSARSLSVMAFVWALGRPCDRFWLRLRSPTTTGSVPGFVELGDPLGFLSEVFLTGYYPVFPWIAYLLAGLAAGRSDLGSRRVAALAARVEGCPGRRSQGRSLVPSSALSIRSVCGNRSSSLERLRLIPGGIWPSPRPTPVPPSTFFTRSALPGRAGGVSPAGCGRAIRWLPGWLPPGG